MAHSTIDLRWVGQELAERNGGPNGACRVETRCRCPSSGPSADRFAGLWRGSLGEFPTVPVTAVSASLFNRGLAAGATFAGPYGNGPYAARPSAGFRRRRFDLAPAACATIGEGQPRCGGAAEAPV